MDNKIMILAFVVGFVGQLLVTEVPFLINIFGTVSLGFVEWIGITLISMMPLVLHEIMVPFNKKDN